MNKGAKDRVVLEGVPRVCFEPHEGKVECTPFPSSLKAVLEYMGEDYLYEYLMGVSGAAFRMVWKPDEWDPGNVDIILMAENPVEPFTRAFEAVGYSYELFGNAAKNHEKDEWFDWMKLVGEYKDPEFLKTRTVESINAGKPVIGFGVVGPPEACVIAGYDKEGDVLLGWNFFQDMPEFAKGAEKEESGYFRKPDWAKDTGAMIFLGEKKDRPEIKDIYHKALKWALDVIRTPQIKDHYTGLAAYETWAEFMQRDDDFPDDMKVLADRNMCFNDGMTMLAEGRWYASLFLSLAARHLPMKASHLLAAASCFAKEHEIAWDIWGLMGGYGWEEEKIRKLASPQVRRNMAELILAARDSDAEAAEHIEKALD
jgi:hypothetical protein